VELVERFRVRSDNGNHLARGDLTAVKHASANCIDHATSGATRGSVPFSLACPETSRSSRMRQFVASSGLRAGRLSDNRSPIGGL
jgi:hypothetical protein